MSAEHRLTAGDAGLYGKHPGFGDFIAAGLPDVIVAMLGDWLQQALGDWRLTAGEAWQVAFDASPRLRFWIGGALTGDLPLRGVWAPLRDRTGRRFPLLVMQAGGVAPVQDSLQEYYVAAERAMAGLFEARQFEPREVAAWLSTELPAPPKQAQPGWPTFWATNPALDPQALLAQLAAADHAHAASGRSYWWFGADRGQHSGMLACQGWPGPSEMDWLIAGGVAARNADGVTA